MPSWDGSLASSSKRDCASPSTTSGSRSPGCVRDRSGRATLVTTVNFLHAYGARVLLVFGLLLGLWGSYLYFRNMQVSGGFRSTFLSLATPMPLTGFVVTVTRMT